MTLLQMKDILGGLCELGNIYMGISAGYMKKLLHYMTIVVLCFPLVLQALPLKKDYPHWDFNNKRMYESLVKIDHFINVNKEKGLVAVFDWDGTLYSEQIHLKEYKLGQLRSGQSAWHIWGAYHLNDQNYSNLLPLYRTQDGLARQHIIMKDDYFEGKTNVHLDDYSKFSQIACFEAGMKPEEMDQAISGYLKMYPTQKYLFYPMMDLMQHLIDEGFNVWIVSGSNPYFISVLLNNIEQTTYYRPGEKYQFNLGKVPYDIHSGHIIGNSAMLSNDGKFTNVYNNIYVKNSDNKLLIVDGKGKTVAIKNYIETRMKKPLAFYAGNSAGDIPAMNYLLSKTNREKMVIAVNPSEKFVQVIQANLKKIVKVFIDKNKN